MSFFRFRFPPQTAIATARRRNAATRLADTSAHIKVAQADGLGEFGKTPPESRTTIRSTIKFHVSINRNNNNRKKNNSQVIITTIVMMMIISTVNINYGYL